MSQYDFVTANGPLDLVEKAGRLDERIWDANAAGITAADRLRDYGALVRPRGRRESPSAGDITFVDVSTL
jgi:hypothetical protein